MYPDPDTLEKIRMTIEQAEANRNWFLGLPSPPANKLVYPPAPEHYEDDYDHQDEESQIEEFTCH